MDIEYRESMRQAGRGGGGSEELTNCSLLVFIPHFWLLKDKNTYRMFGDTDYSI